MQTKAIALATVLGASLFTHLAPLAVADDAIDVAAFDYWDVIETNDGSIWKGVIVEQTPGQQYRLAMLDGSVRVLAAADVVKLTKSRNPGFHQADAGPDAPSKPFKLPTPFARSGVRIGLDLQFTSPSGDLADAFPLETSFTPVLRGGYEQLFGNVGISGGAQIKYTSWQGVDDGASAALTEVHGYVRAALHAGRAAPYAGLSLGVDLASFTYDRFGVDESNTGLGVNLDAGIDVHALPNLAVGLGGTFHPGTTEFPGDDVGESYLGLRLGAALQF